MNKALKVHVGDSLDDIGARAVLAWHRMERGENVNEKHLSFETWEAKVRELSPTRLELLRHVHRDPAKNIRALSLALGRNYRRVHEDVEALEAAGFLDHPRSVQRQNWHPGSVCRSDQGFVGRGEG
jgi:predicted transcriptional regulator